MKDNLIIQAARAHSKNIIGTDWPLLPQLSKSIEDNFKAGVKWCQEQQKINAEEMTTDHNMEIIGRFMDHYKMETGNEIDEHIMLSFFNA